jgi:hypothetical protein
MAESENVQPIETNFDIQSLNEALGAEFEDLGSLKEAIGYKDKYSEVEGRLSDLTQSNSEWESKYSALNDKYGQVVDYFSGDDTIEKLYGSKDRWERLELEKKFPDKDPSIISKVYKSDLSGLSPKDAILLADKLNTPSNISDKDRTSAIYAELGIEDPEELTPVDEYKISKRANQALAELKSIKEFKPEKPEFDFHAESETRAKEKKEQTEALQRKWNEILNKKVIDYEGSSFFSEKDGEKVETFNYKADDNFKKEILPKAVIELTKAGLPVTDENVDIAMNYINEQHIRSNINKIIEAAMTKAATKTEDDVLNEVNSKKDPNDKEAPPVDGKVYKTFAEILTSQSKK